MILIELVRAAKRTSSKGKGHCRTSVGDTFSVPWKRARIWNVITGLVQEQMLTKKEY